MTINNVGKEPATNVNLFGTSVSFSKIKRNAVGGFEVDWPSVDTCRNPLAAEEGFVLFPNPAVGKSESLPIQVTSDMRPHLQSLMDGQEGLLILGCISYSTFDKIRFTQYCYWEHKMPDNSIKAGDCKRGAYAR